VRVLVPLDGTDFAASILPDARRLAGPDGELILINDASILGTRWVADLATIYERNRALESAGEYLQTVARALRAEGAAVQAHALTMGDPALAIEAAATIFHADMIACATHGRGLLGRLIWGSVAWRALVHSPVPVLLRNAREGNGLSPEGQKGRAATRDTAGELSGKRRILVPLDGSLNSERAVPLALRLAARWDAEIRLVHIVPDEWSTPMEQLGDAEENGSEGLRGPGADMLAYLQGIAGRLHGRAQSTVLAGPVVDRLATAVAQWSITDVVMTTHGRTGLPRVILGSVSDALVQRLHCPIVIVPALARAEEQQV
jgi:nucleotide-binding universal stress UspA family protein